MKRRILLIDDEKDFCFFVKKNLELVGEYEVLVAHNSKDGIELAQKEKPNLIFLDILMPGMSGLEAMRVLMEDELTSDIPVVFLTAMVDKKELAGKVSPKGEKPTRFLAKPVSVQDLVKSIKEVFENE